MDTGRTPGEGYLPVAHSRAVAEVIGELAKATKRFAPFNSPHEGWAVIREELDELWEHVRGNTGRGAAARHEALQVAAMALRYAADLGDMSVDKRRCPQFAPHVEHEYGEWWCPGVAIASSAAAPVDGDKQNVCVACAEAEAAR